MTVHDDINIAERRLAPLHSRHEMQISTDTEMRENYREPKQKPELLGNLYHYSSSTNPNMSCCGIGVYKSAYNSTSLKLCIYYCPLCVSVPTVVQRHAQQRRPDLTNYGFVERESRMSQI